MIINQKALPSIHWAWLCIAQWPTIVYRMFIVCSVLILALIYVNFQVAMSEDASVINNLLLEGIRPYVARLCTIGVLHNRDAAKVCYWPLCSILQEEYLIFLVHFLCYLHCQFFPFGCSLLQSFEVCVSGFTSFVWFRT